MEGELQNELVKTRVTSINRNLKRVENVIKIGR